MKLLLVGRSACGKDTLAAILQEKHGLSFVKSHSSRPPRFDGEDTHVFVGKDEAERLVKQAVTWTEIDGNYYFAMRESVEGNDAYIIDPRGLFELVKNMPETEFAVAYLYADPDRRKQASLGRVEPGKRDAEERVFDARVKSEDAQFLDFEENLMSGAGHLPPNIVWTRVYENDYRPKTLDAAAGDIANRLEREI